MKGVGSFYVPNDYVLSLAKQHKEFIPAVSIHPYRNDALEELERCIEKGAAMLRLLPNCHNVDCSDQRYMRFWERMAEAKLPLLPTLEVKIRFLRCAMNSPTHVDLNCHCNAE